MLIPVTLLPLRPITSHQLENCAQLIMQPGTPLPHLAFISAFLKPTGESAALSTGCPGLSAWRPAINAALSFTTTRYQ